MLKKYAGSPVSDKGQGVRSSGCQNPPPHSTRPPRAAPFQRAEKARGEEARSALSAPLCVGRPV